MDPLAVHLPFAKGPAGNSRIQNSLGYCRNQSQRFIWLSIDQSGTCSACDNTCLKGERDQCTLCRSCTMAAEWFTADRIERFLLLASFIRTQIRPNCYSKCNCEITRLEGGSGPLQIGSALYRKPWHAQRDGLRLRGYDRQRQTEQLA